MNNEILLIKYIILNKDIYNNYFKYLNKQFFKEVHKDLYKILLVIEAWYKEDKEAFNSIQDFQAYFFSCYPALKKAESILYQELFRVLDSLNISDIVVAEVLEGHRKRSIASEIASLAQDIAEGKREFLELPRALESLGDYNGIDEVEIEFVTDDLEELFNHTYGRPGLKWKLQTLRKMMGSLRKGDFGFLFARPEVGKTTFLADQCGYFATNGATVLHFNNEEDGRKIKVRYYQTITNTTSRELFGDFERQRKIYFDKTGDRIKIIDSSSMNINRNNIEKVVEKTQPSIIVIDSIDKVEGFEDDRDDLKYKKIYGWARQLAKEYAPIIGVCHASVSGHGKRYLEMDDVAYAKTAKQGEADWILGIGMSHSPEDQIQRHLHLPKNKLMGDEDMDESERHGCNPVRIKPEVAQFEDILKWN